MADRIRNLRSDVSGKEFQETHHVIQDAVTGCVESLTVQFDLCGMTIETSNNEFVTLDFSNSKLNIYHYFQDASSELLTSINIKTNETR